MCLIVFSFKNHKKYPLILAANRDEIFQRPSRPAQFWNSNKSVLAGKDLKAGGTWLGIAKKGRIGALTNYRDLGQKLDGERSRGEIVLDLLRSPDTVPDFLNRLQHRANLYNGFNLLAGNPELFYHFSNQNKEITEIEPGLHGISNAFLNTPWPKVEEAKTKFSQIINSSDDIDEKKIFTMLNSSKTYPPEDLPDTGLPPDLEKAVSSIFIDTKNYGTRCSTLLTIDNNGTARFVEKTYVRNAKEDPAVKRYEFQIERE